MKELSFFFFFFGGAQLTMANQFVNVYIARPNFLWICLNIVALLIGPSIVFLPWIYRSALVATLTLINSFFNHKNRGQYGSIRYFFSNYEHYAFAPLLIPVEMVLVFIWLLIIEVVPYLYNLLIKYCG